ncbi:MAG: hypothetical protein H0V22_06955 [Solirubrobacterales bacterium]|nr:hypothetical protein [Solirubrobacterales bacterium]
MLRAYAADGVDTVVATPHLRTDFPAVVPAEIAGRCEAVGSAAAAGDNHVRIAAGGEGSLTWALDASDGDLRAVSLDGLGRDLLTQPARTRRDPLPAPPVGCPAPRGRAWMRRHAGV